MRIRVGHVIRRLYELFEPYDTGHLRKLTAYERSLVSAGTVIEAQPEIRMRKKRLLAKEALEALQGSKMTITEARRFLGVESRMIAGKHHWLAPKYTLAEALAKAKRGSRATVYTLSKRRTERNVELGKSITKSFIDMMRALHFDVKATTIRREMKTYLGRTFSGTSLTTAKRESGTVTLKMEDGWHWVLPHVEVEQWVEKTLGSQPMAQGQLFELAKAQGYSELLINQFRFGRGFGTFKKDGEWMWYNGNVWGPSEDQKNSVFKKKEPVLVPAASHDSWDDPCPHCGARVVTLRDAITGNHQSGLCQVQGNTLDAKEIE